MDPLFKVVFDCLLRHKFPKIWTWSLGHSTLGLLQSPMSSESVHIVDNTTFLIALIGTPRLIHV